MITDQISDLIIKIKNASAVGKATVIVKQSKFIENVVHALKKAGYLSSVEKVKDTRDILLGLVYFEGEPRVHGVERISKPSRRIYQKSIDIRTYRSGFGNTIISTPKGIMTDIDARKLKVGGEILFKIW
ncbi:MAG: 30S ribosomal protein S8 [Candidatus Paceibacterota bacterium]|jgi:small subunit ribosomal protein S8